MSAIAGIYHLNDEPINLEHGNRMMKELEKYPADDVQTWHNDKVFLGCHAQWITPESVGEKLPYYDHERKLAITADAIIDNRDELFERLQVNKRKQKDITDSELILLSYHKWGEDSPKYLIGDFAFVVWDEIEKKLFGARDFSGARTLYFHFNNSRFSFSTVIHPLFSIPDVNKESNEQWLAEFLVLSGTIDAVDTSITPYKNIFQIPPSHYILVEKGKISFKKYCDLKQQKPIKLKNDEEYVEAFQEVFQEAVNARLRTHLNVGAQLSGGLDSGAVVSYAARTLKEKNKSLYTFSYIPPKDFVDFTPKQLLADERPFIKSTVNYVGGIEDYYLDFHGRNSYLEIDSLLEVLEMPYKFFENSFWLKGMFEKSNEARVGLLLNGDRGNFSISWGFALDYYSILLKKLRWLRLYQELDRYSKNIGGPRLKRLPEIISVGFPFVNQILEHGTTYKLPALINPVFAKNTHVYEKLKEYGIEKTGWFPPSTIFKERKRHFENQFMWNAGNTLAAKLSLHYKLSKRDPTNDLRVIRFCLSIPEDQYVQNGVDRSLIRRATKNLLPDDVRLNQRIRGVQGADWVHRLIPQWDALKNDLKMLSTDKKTLHFLNGQVINNALVKLKEGPKPENATDPEYKILMRSLIVSRFINQFT
ncbi:lasso peptide isopeptide bond-forming cyclase [Bacillus sp. ISL-18]|uniref:lasso peptide isopeptide bond-forming cyclase n=1 Tax=Bacillus sp. ISL-18 TaxID=2819118 RepID=UPI001BEAB58B|nr:lasso peptide isopeptide bond-forming cyclase [Bacillus sp. ISL-18]MBT2657069.1 lasso peptide isopeptide bond-forming cyclase [Bacillus sp. ISL-18]